MKADARSAKNWKMRAASNLAPEALELVAKLRRHPGTLLAQSFRFFGELPTLSRHGVALTLQTALLLR